MKRDMNLLNSYGTLKIDEQNLTRNDDGKRCTEG